MRNGSSRQSTYISGMITNAVAITDRRRLGKIVNRNAAVSRSITIRSTKFAVICTTSCLKRDSSTSTTTSVSDSAPDSAGRPTSAIQKELRKPQVKRKQRREPKSASVVNINASAAICGLASASHLSRPTADGPVIRAVAAEPLFGAGALGSNARQPGVEPGWPTANGPTPQPGPATRHKNVTWTSHFGN